MNFHQKTLHETYVDLLLKTTSELVQIKSINPPGLEDAVGKYIVDFFLRANIKTEIFQEEKNRFNVVAKIKGKSSNNAIAFTGHMDVVPVSEKEFQRWETNPFSGVIKDGFIFGRGSSDMKGGLASVMVAMTEIVKRKIIPSRDIYFIATVDEEDGMKGSKSLLNEHFLEKISFIIVCEPTGLRICTAGKGRTYANIRITGQTGHGSQGKSKNVIDFARQLMNKISGTTFPEHENTAFGNTFWQILSINAGLEPCVIPDELTMKIDARLVPNHKTDEIWKKMKKILIDLKVENPGFEAEIEIIDKREGWILSEKSPIIPSLKQIYNNLQIPFETTYFAGTTDGSIFRRKGIDCLILGPGDLSCVHKENEKISVKELTDSCKIYFEIMKRS